LLAILYCLSFIIIFSTEAVPLVVPLKCASAVDCFRELISIELEGAARLHPPFLQLTYISAPPVQRRKNNVELVHALLNLTPFILRPIMAAMKRLVAALALLVAPSGLAFACKCAPPSVTLNLHTRRAWAEWRLQDAQVVFEGKVDHIEITNWPFKPEPGKTVSMVPAALVAFSNVRLYRGSPRKHYIVETGLGGGDCGYPFKAGESYLVDARAEDDSGRLSTGICSATTPLESAGAALRLLRGEPATPEDLADLGNESDGHEAVTTSSDGKICGRVSFPAGVKPAAVSLRAWPGEEDERSLFGADEVESQSDGSFCFPGLEPGEYVIGAGDADPGDASSRFLGYYPGVLRRSQAKSIHLKPGGSERADFAVVRQPLYKVRGYLRGVPESMADSIGVILMPDPFEFFQVPEPASLGPHGEFQVDGVPPGRYIAFADMEADKANGVTFVSSVANLDVHGDVVGLKLDFVAPKQ
jgi:hypothetical protein